MATTTQVTQEQIDRCERILDLTHNQVFYQVASESDDTTIYEVRYNRQYKRFSCSCPSGQIGFSNCAHGTCKHVRWSVAAEKQYQDFKRSECLAAARIEQERIESTAEYQQEQRVHAVYSACCNLE